MASIKPVLTGTIIGTVILGFPGEKEFPVTGQDAQAVMEYAVRNNIKATLNGHTQSNNGNGRPKRRFTAESIEKMRQARRDYWAAHPERRKKAVVQ